jgi:hypothetical protein
VREVSANGPPAVPPTGGTGSISGFVYVTTGEWQPGDDPLRGLGGVTVRLLWTDSDGDMQELTTTTEEDGSFRFENLAAGTYTLAEDLDELADTRGIGDADDYAGDAGGDVSDDEIQNIQLSAGVSATGYTFTEHYRE